MGFDYFAGPSKSRTDVVRTVQLVSFGRALHVNTDCIVAQVSQNLTGKKKKIIF